MARFEIGINVKTAIAKSGLTGSGKLSPRIAAMPSTTREDMMRVQEIKKGLGKAGLQDPKSKLDKQLMSSLGRLDKTLLKLDKNMMTLGQSVRGGGLGGGVASAGRGLGRGAGVGRVGAAMGMLGVPLAALAFVTSKVIEVGRASMAKVMEQAPTVGVAGLQTGGVYKGVFSAAEFGQYMKERRMAAGTFAPSRKEYKGGLAQAPLGIRTAAIFGTGAEFAKTAGLLDIGARKGRTGEQALSDIISSTMGGGRGGKITGAGTELPLLLREITTGMEDAVREGVNTSNMAKDMASELTTMSRIMPGGQIRTALRISKGISDVQRQAAQGKGGQEGFFMNRAAQAVLMGTGAGSREARQRLLEAGLATPQQLEQVQTGKLPPRELQFLISGLHSQRNWAVKKRYIQDVTAFTGGEGTLEERRGKTLAIGANLLPGMKMTAVVAKNLMNISAVTRATDRYGGLAQQKQARENEMLESFGISRKELQGGGGFIKQFKAAGGYMTPGQIRKYQKLTRLTRAVGAETFEKEMGEEGFTVAGHYERMTGASERERNEWYEQALRRGAKVRGIKGIKGAIEQKQLGKPGMAAIRVVETVDLAMLKMATNMEKTVTDGITGINKVMNGMAKTGVAVATEIDGAVKGTIKLLKELKSTMEDVSKKGFLGYIFNSSP